MSAPRPLSVVLLGQVDHGKSTLLGRLLHDTGTLADGLKEEIAAACARRGIPFEWAFVTDALKTERDQGITIDISRVWLRSCGEEIVLIDAPGHAAFIKNMLTGASDANAALLLIDVKEGLTEQTRRHLLAAHVVGIRHAVIVVNKMDLVGYAEAAFRSVEAPIRRFWESLSGTLPAAVIPISAQCGEGITHASSYMPWYAGSSLLDALHALPHATDTKENAPLRLPVQDVYKQGDARILVGRVESGTVTVGDALLFSPENHSARVTKILDVNHISVAQAAAGECVGIALDAPLFVERGQLASHVDMPPFLTRLIRARLCWLSPTPLTVDESLTLRLHTARYRVELRAIEAVIDPESLHRNPSHTLTHAAIAEVLLRVRGVAALDDPREIAATGRLVLERQGVTVAVGMAMLEGLDDQRITPAAPKARHLSPTRSSIAPEERAEKYGHKGGVLWFTGLSGAGKSTLASALEHRAFQAGWNVLVLDGDRLRSGLCQDLGFAPEERYENIRRAAEVAKIAAETGLLVVTAFISPTEKDRHLAQHILQEKYHSVYIHEPLAACEARDVKGLYRKARTGMIPEFTGISAPFEVPHAPDLTIDTTQESVEACVELLWRYTQRQFQLS